MKIVIFKNRKDIRFLVFAVFSVFTLMRCAHKENNQTDGLPDSVYVNAGNQIVAFTFDSLRSALTSAITTHGIENAITFCNENAHKITNTYTADSFAIKRAALRYRNPDNAPDSLETHILNNMLVENKSGKISTTKITGDNNGTIHYFKPIVMQGMCLSCHGKPGQHIKETTLSRIKALYPKDQAIDFNEGDLRGVWHIIFKAPTQ